VTKAVLYGVTFTMLVYGTFTIVSFTPYHGH